MIYVMFLGASHSYLLTICKNKNEVPHNSIKRCGICDAVPRSHLIMRQIAQIASVIFCKRGARFKLCSLASQPVAVLPPAP